MPRRGWSQLMCGQPNSHRPTPTTWWLYGMAPPGAQLKSEQLRSLQTLRAVAALAVVCHHAFRAVTVHRPRDLLWPPPPLLSGSTLVELGSAGVDIFFVLSGFIMVYITYNARAGALTANHFLRARLLRVWPLYALATLIACAALFLGFFRTGALPFDLQPFRLASFLFIPSFNEHGALQPIVCVGWTLNYEILFYLCFAIALALGRERVVFTVTLLVLLLHCLGHILPTRSVLGAFLGNDVLLEFLFGVWVGAWHHSRSLPAYPILMAVVGAAGLIAAAALPEGFGWRGIVRGLPASAL